MIHDHAYEVRGESLLTGLTLYDACKLLSTWRKRDGVSVNVITRRHCVTRSPRLVAFFCEDKKTVRPFWEATDQEKEDIIENSSFFEVK